MIDSTMDREAPWVQWGTMALISAEALEAAGVASEAVTWVQADPGAQGTTECLHRGLVVPEGLHGSTTEGLLRLTSTGGPMA